MKKIVIITVLSIISIVVFSSACTASWLYFYKPEFKGRILDAETKEPIKDAVVVAVYNTHQYGIADGGTSEIGVRETLTDEKGEFHIPSYFAIINPFSVEEKTSFIIYKPGYGSYPGIPSYPIRYFRNFAEDFFTREIGERGETIKSDVTMEKVIITYGIVELPRVKTKKSRLRAVPSRPTGMRVKDLPLLFKSINEERKKFGLDEVG